MPNDLAMLKAAIANLRNQLVAAKPIRTITGSLEGTVGQLVFQPVPFAGTIEGWCLIADQVGSIVIDVRKCPWSAAPPNSGYSIAGGAKPALSGAQKAESYGALSGWTTAIQAGEVVAFNVDSVSTLTRATLVLRVRPA